MGARTGMGFPVAWLPRSALAAFLVGFLAAAALLALPRTALAQSLSATDVTGHVIYGSGQNGNVGGVTVVLQEMDNTGAEVSRLEATTGPDGTFFFQGVTPKAGHLYRVMTEYAEVRYYGDGYLAEQLAGKTLDLQVYETTTSTENIKVLRQTAIILEVDQTAGFLRVLESTTLSNTGTTTFVGQEDANGQTVTVMIPLPPLAFDVQPGFGFSGQGFLQTQGAIGDVQPLSPGLREMIYSYSVAYVSSEHSFGRAYPYPVDEVRVLSPLGLMAVRPDGLAKGESVVIAGKTYESYSMADIQSGQRVGVVIRGLPVSEGVRSRDLLETLRWVALGVVVIALLGVIGVYVWRRRARSNGPAAAPAVSPRAALVERLAAVEAAHRSGRLTDEEYRRQRAQIRENLQDILASEGG